MARTKHKGNLSSRELMQLTLWGGLLLVILIGLVYGLVRVGAVIPVGSGAAASRGRGHSRCHSSFAARRGQAIRDSCLAVASAPANNDSGCRDACQALPSHLLR